MMLNIHSDQDLFCKFSRSTMRAFMFASIATLLAITVDRYVYIVKPMRYTWIVTHPRVFLAVANLDNCQLPFLGPLYAPREPCIALGFEVFASYLEQFIYSPMLLLDIFLLF